VKVSWIWLIGLVPLLALGMLLLGASMGTVPFNNVLTVGWTLAFGSGLLLISAAIRIRENGLKDWAIYPLVLLGLAQGGLGLWTVRTPAAPAALLVTANPEQMGALASGYVDIFPHAPQIPALTEALVADAPYSQIFTFHLSHGSLSIAQGVPDACVTRLSSESPAMILDLLDDALDAFGDIDGQLAPLAAVLDMNAADIEPAALVAHVVPLYGLAPPDGPFLNLADAIIDAVAAHAEASTGLADGDRALAALIVAAREDRAPRVHLDVRGAPAGQHALDHLFPRWYLRAGPDVDSDKVVRARYRELRAGEIVQTSDGYRPVDIVDAELEIRVTHGEEVLYERAFTGASPIDSWKVADPSLTLRQAYRRIAVEALTNDIAPQFSDLVIE
jgi:hypothetical protein